MHWRELASRGTVLFDLDGTLVRLLVNWEHVNATVDAFLNAHHAERLAAESFWEKMEHARDSGLDVVWDWVAEIEETGARLGALLPLGRALRDEGLPGTRVAVITLNSRRAAQAALAQFHCARRVDAVVTREDVTHLKPAPDVVYRALDAVKGDPADAILVGDSKRDAEAAAAAGVAFVHVGDVDLPGDVVSGPPPRARS